MRRLLPLILLALVVSFARPLAQSPAEANVIGKWSGAYAGDASGKYTMTIERDAAKKLGGSLTNTNEAGESFTAKFKTVTVTGPTLSITYDAPGNQSSEVQVAATIEKGALTGTWKILNSEKAVSQSGTFTGTRD